MGRGEIHFDLSWEGDRPYLKQKDEYEGHSHNPDKQCW